MFKILASRKYPSKLCFGTCVLLALAHPALSADTDQEKAAANFRLADTNSDSALSTVEFTVFIDLNAASNLGRAPMIKRNRAYDVAFSRVDSNGDGMVTPAELQGLGL